jgi:taurine dioxygenase
MKALRDAFLQYGVLVFSGQGHITPEEHIAFGKQWGEVHLMPTDKRCLNGNRALLVLDWEDQRPATDMWHSDVSMDACPPLGSLLLARAIPVGGDTIFANQYLAYESLSDGMKKMLNGLKAWHTGDVYGKAGGMDPATLPRNVHPVVRTHPETGRKALYVNEIYTTQFEGWSQEESEPVLRWLYAHATQPNFTFRHRWTVGDMLVWDNRCVQHFAVYDYGKQRRTMHRVTILGDKPR